jgi:hypothetical protein
MSQRDKIESFIQEQFNKSKGKKITKTSLLESAQSETFAADVVIFFKQIPDQSYDQDSLIDALNTVIRQRGRTDAIGGLLRIPEKVTSH